MLRTAVALRHVAFEDLGCFETVLATAGYKLHIYDVGVDDLWTLDPVKTELLIVLGGPIGVGDTAAYPVLTEELSLLRARLSENRPTFGLCLGAQLMAAALGAKVAPMGHREIGFSPLALTESGRRSPLRHLDGVNVLHWHGDMFEIPHGATCLAATELCPHQGFALGPNIMGLQCHPEVDGGTGFERWLIGHAGELSAAGIDPDLLRTEAARAAPLRRQAGQALFAEWLYGVQR